MDRTNVRFLSPHFRPLWSFEVPKLNDQLFASQRNRMPNDRVKDITAVDVHYLWCWKLPDMHLFCEPPYLQVHAAHAQVQIDPLRRCLR
jgi:hypothetical protein